MNEQASRHLQLETAFLSGVDANFEAAKGKHLRGTTWQRTHHDEVDRVRALMAQSRIFDRDVLKSLPANRRTALHGYERYMLFWRKRTGVAVASTISPIAHDLSGGASPPPPVGLGELAEHVRRLIVDQRVPHIVGVLSTSGFAAEVRSSKLEFPNVTLVLVEPDGAGGWKVTPASGSLPDSVLKLFDPEGDRDKIARARALVEENSADMLTGGLLASNLAARARLPEHLVRRAFEELAAADPELHVSKKDGACLLFRGAPVMNREKPAMGVIDRIKQLFSREGDDAEKVNILAERRAALAQRRDRLFEDIAKLEKKEADLLAQGKAATSMVPKRRIAAQLAQIRKDITRQNTTAAMLNQQIDIISTDIHNLTLIKQGEMADLPDTHELTENAVRAEELLESLKADSEMINSLAGGMTDTVTSDEEREILKEFEQTPPAAAAERSAAGPAAAPSSARDAARPQRAEPPPLKEPGSAGKAKGATPEAT